MAPETADALEIADALRFAGVDRSDWNNALSRGIYTEPPPAQPGKPRHFNTDDLVALAVLGRLLDLGVTPSQACRLASDTRAWLRRDNRLRELYIERVTDRHGQPRAEVVERLPEGALPLWRVHVLGLRKEARKAIAERFAREAESSE